MSARQPFLDPGGLRPRGPPSPSLAGPRDPRSAPAGAPVARLARYAAAATSTKFSFRAASRANEKDARNGVSIVAAYAAHESTQANSLEYRQLFDALDAARTSWSW